MKKIKARIRNTNEREKQIVEAKYGWKEHKPIHILGSDIWRIVVFAICLVATYLSTELNWSTGQVTVLSWPAMAVISLVMLEMIYYFIAVRGKITRADKFEVGGYKIISFGLAAANMLLYPLWVVAIPIFGFIHLNQVWTNQLRFENYKNRKSL